MQEEVEKEKRKEEEAKTEYENEERTVMIDLMSETVWNMCSYDSETSILRSSISVQV